MQIVLNEYSLALLCGGISCITYLLINFGRQSTSSRSVTILDTKVKKRRTRPILRCTDATASGHDCSGHADNACPGQEDDDDENDSEDWTLPDRIGLRRQSHNLRVKQKRSDSLLVKSEHVIFADEITADDEKFSPSHNDISPDTIEGILSKSEDEPHLAVNPDIVDVEPLNRFEEIQPLDDRLLRRRSLHSTPSGSHHGSRSNLSALDREGDEQEEEGEEEVSAGRARSSTKHAYFQHNGDSDIEDLLQGASDIQDALDMSRVRERVQMLEHELEEKRKETSRQSRSLQVLEDSLQHERTDKEELANLVSYLQDVLRVAVDKMNGQSVGQDGLAMLQQYMSKEQA